MSRILITGSAGKVGKELVGIMSEHELLLVDKKGENSVQCDLATDDLKFIAEFRPEIIIHLAASFERTDETPQFHWINQKDNILATYRLNELIASLDYCPSQYIFASSYLVYDPALYLSNYPLKAPRELSEVDELNPRNLIGASKLYAEKEIDFLKRNVHNNMMVTNARIFRVFGEGGQEFISRIIQWKGMNIQVDIWKPENSFDYIYTKDCAEALKSLIGFDGIYNVGSGESTRIDKIIQSIGPQIRYISKDDLFESTVADISKIKETTGWEPKTNVVDWIKSKCG